MGTSHSSASGVPENTSGDAAEVGVEGEENIHLR